MAENVRARDLALTDFASVDQSDRIAVALTMLIEVQGHEHRPKALIVHDGDGGFVGMLSARLLARVLVSEWSPSADDLTFTRRMAEAGELLGVRLLDHVILGSAGRWVSLGRRGAW